MSHKLKAIASRIGGTYVAASVASTASGDGDFSESAVQALSESGISVRSAGDAYVRLGTGSLWISSRDKGKGFEVGIMHPSLDTSIKLEDKPMQKLTRKTISAIVKQATKLDEALNALVSL